MFNVVSELFNNVKNSCNEGIVDIYFSNWTEAADEINNTEYYGVMEHKGKKLCSFYFCSSIEKEHCSLKATLLIHQMHAQYYENALNGIYNPDELRE